MAKFDPISCQDFAIKIVKQASKILMSYFNKEKVILKKSNEFDLVTIADQKCEQYLIKQIQKKYPDHEIIAEESALSLTVKSKKFTWIIDPLDGTTNFNHGIPHFAISLAVCQGPKALVAVTYDPNRKELFTATNKTKSLLNKTPIRVTKTRKFSEAMLTTGVPYDRFSKEYDHTHDLMREYKKSCRGLRRFGAATLDCAWVACGRIDGFFEYHLKPWDTAAGKLLITQAGGRILQDRPDLIQVDNGKLEWKKIAN